MRGQIKDGTAKADCSILLLHDDQCKTRILIYFQEEADCGLNNSNSGTTPCTITMKHEVFTTKDQRIRPGKQDQCYSSDQTFRLLGRIRKGWSLVETLPL